MDNFVGLGSFEAEKVNETNPDPFASTASTPEEQLGMEELNRLINQQAAIGSQVTLEGVDISLGDSFVVSEDIDTVASRTNSEGTSASTVSDDQSSVQRDVSSSDASSQNDDESVSSKRSEDNSSTSSDSVTSSANQKIVVFTIPQKLVESRLIESDVISSETAMKVLNLTDLSNRKSLSLPLIQSTLRRMRGIVSGSL